MAKVSGSYQLTPEARQKLEELAEQYNTSFNEIIEACLKFVSENNIKINPEPRGNKGKKFIK